MTSELNTIIDRTLIRYETMSENKYANKMSKTRARRHSNHNLILFLLVITIVVLSVTDTLDTIISQLHCRPKVNNNQRKSTWVLMSCVDYLDNSTNKAASLHNTQYRYIPDRINEPPNQYHYNHLAINKPQENNWITSFSMLYLNLRFKQNTFLSIRQVNAIRLIRLDVTHPVYVGQSLRLRCLYDNKGDKLQTLSWIKNGREFYRYQPFDRRKPTLTFNSTGLNIDESKSKDNTVVLTNITRETSGRYRCEVTGNTFQEVNMETFVNVLPANSSYRYSDNLNRWMPYFLVLITFTLLLIK